jgi:hypothetical protein
VRQELRSDAGARITYTQHHRIAFLFSGQPYLTAFVGVLGSVGEQVHEYLLDAGSICRATTEQFGERHTAATEKVRVWASRADKARNEGRRADADRCDDKVRD